MKKESFLKQWPLHSHFSYILWSLPHPLSFHLKRYNNLYREMGSGLFI